MKTYTVTALYTISVTMEIEAENDDEAIEKAEECEYSIDTEWNGNSVFVRDVPDGVTNMTLCADGTLRDFSVDE